MSGSSTMASPGRRFTAVSNAVCQVAVTLKTVTRDRRERYSGKSVKSVIAMYAETVLAIQAFDVSAPGRV
jgi:hypothetical protein